MLVVAVVVVVSDARSPGSKGQMDSGNVVQGDSERSMDRERGAMARSKDHAANRRWCSGSKGPLNLDGGTS